MSDNVNAIWKSHNGARSFMDVSYILSADELFTLMSLVTEHSEAGTQFGADALQGAEVCDLGGLVGKKMAKQGVDGEVELAPVLGMLAESIARAERIEQDDGGWLVFSPLVMSRCEVYRYKEGHFKITPIEG